MRKCLREFGKDLQRQGEIPLDVSDAELYREMERHVPKILVTIQRKAMYDEWKTTGHLQEHLRFLIQQTLSKPPKSEPAVPSDQITYIYAPTGESHSRSQTVLRRC